MERTTTGVEPVSRDVARELAYALRPPFQWLSGVVVNLVIALAVLAWLVVEAHSRSGLHGGLYARLSPHIRHRGSAGVFVTGWLLSDVISTNLLGSEVERNRLLLQRRGSVGQVLLVRGAMLAVIAASIGVLCSVAGEWATDSWRFLPRDLFLSLAPVFVWVGVGTLVSVVLPVRQLTLRERWRNRRTWPRWLVSLGLPYVLAGAVIPVLVGPLLAMHLIGSARLEALRLPGVLRVDIWAAVIGMGCAMVAARLANATGGRLARLVWLPKVSFGASVLGTEAARAQR